ncbi:hypothetical protein [Ralstonia pseudosolanacearum]|uniref:hypothetical protein n=1 Tax=Ralstonia pseudosolanacearum TaxID=1310165 RepID=UPI000ACA6B03|nr:hypothetical protein [Ralstonia pseudosolanacearum]NKF92539.1 hypothetical protein [Ralstonia solanacearum]NKG07104.1 hypothetical protein [Ralstonia solanacearum]
MKSSIHLLARGGALALLLAAGQACASEYGCKVLLCLSNPASNGGPRGLADCVQPINQLFDDLLHGRPFPSCEEAEATGNRAVQVFDPFDPCPAPLEPAEAVQYIVQGRRTPNAGVFGFALDGTPQMGMNSQRACVGKVAGSYQIGGADDGYKVTVFEKVEWQKAQSPRAIDIFQDNVWDQRVHW